MSDSSLIEQGSPASRPALRAPISILHQKLATPSKHHVRKYRRSRYFPLIIHEQEWPATACEKIVGRRSSQEHHRWLNDWAQSSEPNSLHGFAYLVLKGPSTVAGTNAWSTSSGCWQSLLIKNMGPVYIERCCEK